MNYNLKRSVTHKGQMKSNKKRGKTFLAIYSSRLKKTQKEMRRYSIRRGLMNGYVDEKLYNYSLKALIDRESIEVGYATMKHHPVISTIAEDIMGASRKIPLFASIKSSSGEINDEKLLEWENRVTENFNKAAIGGFLKKGQLKSLESNLKLGLTDAEDAQFQAELIDTDLEDIDVKGITKDIEENYKLPIEVQAQKVVNLLIQKCEVSKLKIDTMEDIIPTNEIYIVAGMDRHEPFIKRMSPEDFTNIPSPHSPKVEDSVAGVWSQRVSIQQAFQMDGEHFTTSDIKKLEKMAVAITDGVIPNQHRKLGDINDGEVSIEYIRTYETSQNKEQSVSEIGKDENWNRIEYRFSPDTNLTQASLVRKYVAWKDFIKYKQVTRIENGKKVKYIEAENYEFNPDIDEDIKTIEYVSVWHGVQYEGVGGGGDVGSDYLVQIKVEEIKYPKTDRIKPWDKKLPFFGGKLNTRNGKAENRSIIDNALTDQYDYDLFSEMLKREQATNYGKVMSFIKEFKPTNTSWTEFFSMMKNMHLLMIDPYKDEFANIPGALQNAMNAYKELDLSNNSNIVEIINKLIYHEQRIARIMLYNSESSGMISPYAKTANVAAALSSTQSRLSNIFENQRDVIERALTYLFNMSIQYYSENQEEISYVFKSANKMFSQLNWTSLTAADLGIIITTNTNEMSKVDLIKGQLLSIIQNQMADYKGIIDTVDADTMQDLHKIAIALDQRMSEKQQASQEANMQQIQLQGQQKQQENDRLFAQKKELTQMSNDNKIELANINSESLAKQFDINKDGQNDMVQLQETKNAIEMKKVEIDRMKVLNEIKMKRRDLELKEQKMYLDYKKKTA